MGTAHITSSGRTSQVNMSISELYRFLRFLQELHAEYDAKRTINADDIIALHNIDEMLVETKRKIRALNHRSAPQPDGVIETGGINHDCSYIEIVLLEPSFSREEAEAFFEEHMFRGYVYYSWDCTGQHFTQWHRIFRTPRGWKIYHSIGIDI